MGLYHLANISTLDTMLTTLFKKIKASPSAHAPSLAEPHLSHELRLNWRIDQAQAVLHCENRTPVYACFEGLEGPEFYQTLILQTDLENNRLFLEAFAPRLPLPSIYALGVFFLTIPSVTGAFRLRCVAVAEHGIGCVQVKVLERCDPAQPLKMVKFPAQLRPTAQLLVPLYRKVTAQVTAIQVNEAALVCASPYPELRRHSVGDCNIVFSDHFSFQTSVRIKDIKHLRKPHYHSELRLCFQHHKPDLRIQLEDFIQALHSSAFESKPEGTSD